MMEQDRISAGEIRVFRVFQADPSRWLTAKEVGDRVEGVSMRSVREKLKKFAEAGLLEQAELFPSYRYRLAERASKRSTAYVARLDAAAAASGL